MLPDINGPGRLPRPQVSSEDIHCAICGLSETDSLLKFGKKLASDHDHANGKERGFLCHDHNLGIGMFGDDPLLLKKAIGYLYYWRNKHVGRDVKVWAKQDSELPLSRR